MKVLALDIGFCVTGCAVFDYGLSGRWTPIALKAIETKPSSKKKSIRAADDNVRRVREIARGVIGLIHEHQPAGMLVELPGGGAKSAIAMRAMAYVAGMAGTIEEGLSISTEYFSPDETRKAGGGRVTASKDDVIAGVTRFYPQLAKMMGGMTKAHREAVADAVATFEAGRGGNLVKMAQERRS